ncbi:MAG: hypothetical protein AAB316_20375, partial [Bacteroidota bacterium]
YHNCCHSVKKSKRQIKKGEPGKSWLAFFICRLPEKRKGATTEAVTPHTMKHYILRSIRGNRKGEYR